MNSERYSRQIQLKNFGENAQQKLFNAKVLVVGAGGLGIPVLTYLNAMGVGTLGVVDDDIVSLTNLQRQVAYAESDIGQSKITVIAKVLKTQNSKTVLNLYNEFLTITNALAIISLYDVIVDASDNFATRYLLNDACVILNKPFIYGALHGFEGQISVFNYHNGPTYRCLFPNMPNIDEVPNCDENGVLGVVPGIIGNLQALETVKVITGVGEVLSGKLLLFDGLTQNYQKISFNSVAENRQISTLKNDYGFQCATNFSSLDMADFEALFATKSLQVLDVRTAQEFEAFHLKKSIHIPLAKLEKATVILDFKKPIYVICATGNRSQKAIQVLQENYPNATFFNIEGGIQKGKHYAHKY